MQKNMKIINFILIILLILPMITNLGIFTSYAAISVTIEGVTYTYNEKDTLTITGSGIVSNNWKNSSELSSYIGNIKTVIFNSNELTAIGEDAFSDCTALTTITYTKHAITSIGNHAFSGCTSLINVVIPNSCTVIGDYAFYRCTSLTTVTIGSTYVDKFELNKGYTVKKGLEKIGNYAFYGCTSISKFGHKIQMIGVDNKTAVDRTVYNMLNFNINSIGNYAFYGCKKLGVFTLNENIKYQNIGSNAFDDSVIVRYPNIQGYNTTIKINKSISVNVPTGGKTTSKSENLISNIEFSNGDKVYISTSANSCQHVTNFIQVKLTNQNTNEITQWTVRCSGNLIKNVSDPYYTNRYDCVVIPKDGIYKIDATVSCQACQWRRQSVVV